MTRVPDVERAVRQLTRVGLAVGVVAGLLCAAGAFFDVQAFVRAWLMAFVFWWEVAVGCLALACIYQMTGGAWGFVARPFFDSGVRTLPLLALAFVPIALGLEHLYVWTDPSFFEQHEHTENRQVYLDEPFFLGRTIGYFVVWMFFGMILTWSTVRGRNQPVTPAMQRLGRIGGLGAAFLLLTVSFAAFDWIMSLTPMWQSTMFGALVAAGAMLQGMALTAACVALFLHTPTAPEVEPRQVLNDLGNLLMAFVMVWTYFSFSQYLIVWSGNLPEEVEWYTARLEQGWQWMAPTVSILHFVVPFLLLLSRDIKRSPARLGAVAIGLMIVHYLEVFWTIKPSLSERASLHWLDLVAPLALGGFFLAVYGWELRRRLLPVAELLVGELGEPAGGHHD